MKKSIFLLAMGLVALAASLIAAADEAKPQENKKDPQMQIEELLGKAGAFYLATVDGDQPKLRPLGAHHLVDGKVWLGVGEFKNVYKQLVKNPKCEVVALQPEGGKWLRWTGKATFAEGEEREKLEKVFLDAMPGLRKIYDGSEGKRMMCFTLTEARAELITLMPPGEVILDDTAKKTAVVYYSWSPDGNTRFAAQTIAKKAGADLFEIIAETPYNSDFDKCCDEAKPECRNKTLRPIKPIEGFDLAKYDTVFVGSPNWWGTLAPPVYTWIKENQAALKGKKVALFQTNGGGGMQNLGRDFEKAVGEGVTVLPPKAFNGSSVKSSVEALEKFVDERVK
jgi:uncharacterized pyridoxamine 5'-phosphate oxidase family protein/flavodoxin